MVRRRRGLALNAPAALAGLAALGWFGVIAGTFAGGGVLLDHDRMFAAGLPSLGRCAGFAVAWFVMVAATMLPSEALALSERSAPYAVRSLCARLIGFFAVWELFGFALLCSDGALHYLVRTNAWLYDNTYVVAAAVLTLVAVGQFHLAEAKNRRGLEAPPPTTPAATFSLRSGCESGVHGIVRCWTIMLFMMAATLHDPRALAVSAVLVAYQQYGRWGARVARALGIVALGDALVVLALRTSTL